MSGRDGGGAMSGRDGGGAMSGRDEAAAMNDPQRTGREGGADEPR